MGKIVDRQQCPECQDSGEDNLCIYEDGSTYCHACKYTSRSTNKSVVNKKLTTEKRPLIKGIFSALQSRGITESTCRHFNYQVGKFTGWFGKKRYAENEWVQIANYPDEYGAVKAQKLRAADKSMTILGDFTNVGLYAKWLWQQTDKLFITIVEGEIDTLTVAQVQGLQYPVVSVPAGAASAKASIEKDLQWLMGFKHVVLALDNDKDGIKATKDCLTLFEPGFARIAQWPLKDANEMLNAGREDEIGRVIFNAKIIKPDNIVTVEDIIEEVLVQPQRGTDYPFPSLTDITYGFQPGEIHIIVGANGIGKTEYVKELMFHFLQQDLKIGLFSFEQQPQSTVRRLVGSVLQQKLHLPGAEWNPVAIKKEAMKLNGKIYLDKNASADTLILQNCIRYLVRAKGIKIVIIDNLKGLTKGQKDSLDHLKQAMLTFQALALELRVTFILLSHVAKDKYNYNAYVSTSPKNPGAYADQTAEDIEALVKRPGMEWESGRMPSKENVEGAGTICDLADYVFALARNTTAEDENEKRTMRVKCLKARLDGTKTGKTFKLFYDETGRLVETDTSGGF